MRLIQGDCLEVMKDIPISSVDAIITDPPYGTTVCKWDSIIPLKPMWEQLKRIIKPNGAIVMTASQPFTTILISSNMKMFKYCWVWIKNRGSNFALCKKVPIKEHEDIVVFYMKMPTYNYQMQPRTGGGAERVKRPFKKNRNKISDHGIEVRGKEILTKLRYPSSHQKFNCEVGLHPTQKPVALMEYLIKTYTNEKETVLDFAMGSGTTGVACKKLNRNFIGIEIDKKYFEIAKKRIEGVYKLM